MNFQAKESSVKSKDECERSDSSDEPENSLNQFYENDIVMVIIKICHFLGDNSREILSLFFCI